MSVAPPLRRSEPHAPPVALLRPGEPILVTRLRHIGDVLLSLPLLSALRRALPESPIHYLADAGPLELLRSQPEVDVRWTAPRGYVATLALARRLHAERYAAAIDLFCNARSALLVRATGARVRVGEDRRVRRHAYTLARRLVPGRSAIEQHLDALRGLGLQVPPPQRPALRLAETELGMAALRWQRIAAHPRVVLHLAATQPAKEWPLAAAIAFARRLVSARVAVVLTRAPHRPEPSVELAERLGGSVTLLPVLPLRELLALVAHATAVVAVDGGIAHAAVALGRPTVALFGPTDPRIWFPYESFGPYRVLHAGIDCGHCDRVLCPDRRCMTALAPDAVGAALDAVLGAAGGAA